MIKNIFLTISIFLFLTSVSKSERKYFQSTINELIQQGYKVIQITKEGDVHLYHLTNGKEIVICRTGYSYSISHCSKD